MSSLPHAFNRIVLIGCGKEKAISRSAARDLYIGTLFRDRLAYADATGSPVWIVSAKHGLLRLDELVSPYDVTIGDLSEVDRAGWMLGVAGRLVDEMPDNAHLRGIAVELHMSGEYAEPLRETLQAIGFHNTTHPVRGLGIGAQRKWYQNRSRRQVLHG